MTDFVINDERSLKTRQGAVGRGIRWIYRFMDAAHAENLVVPIDQARQIPSEHTDMLEFWVNYCVSIDHGVFSDSTHSSIAMIFMGHLDESWTCGCREDCNAKASGLMAHSPIRITLSIPRKRKRTRHSKSDWNAESAGWRSAVGEAPRTEITCIQIRAASD